MGRKAKQKKSVGRPPIGEKARLAKITLRLAAEEIAALKAHAKRAGTPFTRFAVSVLEKAGVLKAPRRASRRKVAGK